MLGHQISWINKLFSKTIFGVLGQASVATSLITASLHGIISSLGNNSAVFCYLCYIKSKNAEVKGKNEKIRIDIENLREQFRSEFLSQTSNANILGESTSLDPKKAELEEIPTALQKSSYQNLWGLGTRETYKEPFTYMLIASFIADIANAVTMVTFLQSSESISFSNSTSYNSTTSNVDVIDKICTYGSDTQLGKVAAALGGVAVLLAFPQIVVAHNLREYQNELRRERKQLKALINKYRQKQFTDRMAILEAQNTTLSDEVASFFQDLGLPVIVGSDSISNLQELRKIFQEVIVLNPTLQQTLRPVLQKAQQRLRSGEHTESSGSRYKHHRRKKRAKSNKSHNTFFSDKETKKDSPSDDTTTIASLANQT